MWFSCFSHMCIKLVYVIKIVSFALPTQCEPAKFKKGIQWMNKLLYKTVLDADRIKTIANKLVNDVARLKRNGSKIVSALMKGTRYVKGVFQR